MAEPILCEFHNVPASKMVAARLEDENELSRMPICQACCEVYANRDDTLVEDLDVDILKSSRRPFFSRINQKMREVVWEEAYPQLLTGLQWKTELSTHKLVNLERKAWSSHEKTTTEETGKAADVVE